MRSRLRPPRIFYGWWVVLGGLVINTYHSGVFFYGFTAFFTPIVNEFGWSRSVTSFAFSIYRLEGGLLAPVVGLLVDRLGSRKLMMAGAILLGLGFLALSQIWDLWSFYGALVFLSLGLSCTGVLVTFTVVTNWFVRRRSLAMSLTALAGGISGAMVPLVSFSIEQIGWRNTLILAGIGAWLICFPFALLMRRGPEYYGLRPDGDGPESDSSEETARSGRPAQEPVGAHALEPSYTTSQAVHLRVFWLMSIAIAVGSMAENAVVVHQIPYLLTLGIPAPLGALVVSVTTMTSLIGRVAFGVIGDRMEKRVALALCIGMQTGGIAVLTHATGWWQLVVFGLLYGISTGWMVPLRPALQADYLGRHSFGTIQGLIMAARTVGTMIGPVAAGLAFDLSGSYYWGFLLLTISSAASIPVILAMGPSQPATPPRAMQAEG